MCPSDGSTGNVTWTYSERKQESPNAWRFWREKLPKKNLTYKPFILLFFYFKGDGALWLLLLESVVKAPYILPHSPLCANIECWYSLWLQIKISLESSRITFRQLFPVMIENRTNKIIQPWEDFFHLWSQNSAVWWLSLSWVSGAEF